MVKKLGATAQRFSVAAKNAHAVERKNHEAQEALNEKMLDESILPLDILACRTEDRWHRMLTAEYNGKTIAIVSHENNSPFVHCTFLDAEHTQVQIQNVEACRPMLTVRKVVAAMMLPYGAAELAKLVRKCDAEAEASLIHAATGVAAAAPHPIRL